MMTGKPENCLARRWALLVCAGVVLAYCGFGILMVHRGQLTEDEGIYAWAAICVMKGQRPYRDFLFTQMPLLPYFYGAAMSLVGRSMTAARYISFGLGISSLVMTTVACRRLAGWHAAIINAGLLGLNLSYVFDTCNVKTQSLTVFWTALSMLVLSSGSTFAAPVGVIVMAVAVLTRLAVLPALLLLWALLLLDQRTRASSVPAIVGSAVLLAMSASFFNKNGNMTFGVYEFHKAYFGDLRLSLDDVDGFVKGSLSNQLPIVAAVLWASILLLLGFWKSISERERLVVALAGAGWLLMTLLHASRTASYPTHQTSCIAFASVYASVVLGRWVSVAEPLTGRSALLHILALCVITMPLEQYDVRLSGNGSIPRLAEAAAHLRKLANPGDGLLTWSPELSVETGIPMLPSYEQGEFSFFPRMEENRAAELHVLGQATIRQELTSGRARVVCLTDRHLRMIAGGGPDWLVDILRSRYDPPVVVPFYGQFDENLAIFVAKPLPSTP